MKSNFSKKPKQQKAKDAFFEVREVEALMPFLMAQMPHKNRHNIKTMMGNKQVLVDGKVVTQFNYPLNPGQKVELATERIAREKQYRGISIIYEDHYLIVIDKHAGILSMATDNEKDHTAYSMLSNHVKEQNPEHKIFIVHRLDRDTSGLMLFAKSEEIKYALQETWNETVIERTYVAVVEGRVSEEEGTIISYLKENNAFKVFSSQNPNNGLKSITHFKLLRSCNYFSLLQLNLETGRKNQIRVHMQDIGHSIVGDKKYGAKTNPMKRLGLHANILSFKHPKTNEILKFETPIPRKFLNLLD
ncbi:MAG: RluA family pseudouridine synthase [Bacteroidales bacterium]|nr:RluA family pseudouridine synthase [Bacteroidales bacterium]